MMFGGDGLWVVFVMWIFIVFIFVFVFFCIYIRVYVVESYGLDDYVYNFVFVSLFLFKVLLN